MKIDLYNNHEVFIKESKQDRDISFWLRRKGIKVRDLEQHPQISDVIKLIELREHLWNRMSFNEQAVWGAYWNIVYHKKFCLRDKAWKKFEKIVMAIDQREIIMAQYRQKINTLKLEKTQNP